MQSPVVRVGELGGRERERETCGVADFNHVPNFSPQHTEIFTGVGMSRGGGRGLWDKGGGVDME